jgi:hypothetical protein
MLLHAPLRAQATGPQAPAAPQDAPPAPVYVPPQAPRPAPSANGPTVARAQNSTISKDPPSVPVDQIIQTFAQHESEFKTERDNFTYTQDFLVQTVDDDGRADGEYHMTSDITYTRDGKRNEYVTYAPAPTLERVTLSQSDFDDLRNITPFVLTSEDLPQYTVTYVGRQQVDQIGTYVFDVGPKAIVKGHRYFQGRIWVDDRDFEIVKTSGKAVPQITKHGSEDLSPAFDMYRDNIEGHFWFPIYAHADDYLNFEAGAVHIRMTVRWTNYKRFRVSSRIIPNSTVVVPNSPPPAATPPK